MPKHARSPSLEDEEDHEAKRMQFQRPSETPPRYSLTASMDMYKRSHTNHERHLIRQARITNLQKNQEACFSSSEFTPMETDETRRQSISFFESEQRIQERIEAVTKATEVATLSAIQFFSTLAVQMQIPSPTRPTRPTTTTLPTAPSSNIDRCPLTPWRRERMRQARIRYQDRQKNGKLVGENSFLSRLTDMSNKVSILTIEDFEDDAEMEDSSSDDEDGGDMIIGDENEDVFVDVVERKLRPLSLD